MPPLIEQTLAMEDNHMQSFSPMLNIASARHETQYSHLFHS